MVAADMGQCLGGRSTQGRTCSNGFGESEGIQDEFLTERRKMRWGTESGILQSGQGWRVKWRIVAQIEGKSLGPSEVSRERGCGSKARDIETGESGQGGVRKQVCVQLTEGTQPSYRSGEGGAG